jgi:ElaB/YqjD/DUF883 family membrane-anchored ribosome-binding protein
MPRRFRTAVTAFVVGLTALAVTACDDTAEDDVAQACDQAAETRGQAEEVRSLDLGAVTGEEIRDELVELRDDAELLLAEVRDVASDRADELESALAALTDAIDAVGEQPLTDARAEIQAGLAGLEQGIQQALNGLDCP